MKFKTTKPCIEVYFDNGCRVGTITYDSLWKEWRISFEQGIYLSKYWIKDIYKFLKKLR